MMGDGKADERYGVHGLNRVYIYSGCLYIFNQQPGTTVSLMEISILAKAHLPKLRRELTVT